MFQLILLWLYADKEATSPIKTMTADQAGNLIFKPPAFESTRPSLLSASVPGKDIAMFGDRSLKEW